MGSHARRGLGILVLFLPLFPASLLAGPGGTTGDILKLSLSPRAAAMGDAFAAIPDDLGSLSYNPAGLASLSRQEVNAMHARLVQDLVMQEVSYGRPTPWGTFAGQAMLMDSDAVEAFDANNQPLGTVKAQDTLLRIGYARPIYGSWSGGVGFGVLSETLARVTAWTTTVDLGLASHYLDRRLFLGLAYRNLGPGLKFDEASDPLPQVLDVGVAWWEGWAGNRKILLAADFLKPAERSLQTHLGSEIWFFDLMAIRLGYVTEQDVGTAVRLGLGLKARGLGFDYSITPMGDLGEVHRIGLSCRFGGKDGAQAARVYAK